MGLAAGLNSYAYVSGDPIDYYDSYGLFYLPDIPQPAFDFTMGALDSLSWGIAPILRSDYDLPQGG